MTFGTERPDGAPRDEARRIFDAYVERGGNFIDTANRYTAGTSERWVGKFVGAERDRFVVATKYTLATRSGDPNGAGNSRKHLTQSLDASLKRLGMDYVDLYWVHAWDSLTPVDEVVRALDDAVSAGKVLYVGASDTPAWVVSRANTLADLRGWSPFVGVQVEYSLIQRTVERELVPMARALDLAVLAWSPLAGGALTGKYLSPNPDAEGPDRGRLAATSPRRNERNTAIARETRAVADEIGHSPAQVAINWLRQRRGVVIPILGARTHAQFADTLGALDFELAPEHLARLDQASAPELGFPHECLASPQGTSMLYADTLPLLRDRDRLPR
jgi:aryl-alcohol dehydrogenase-like predicted oxidoreductase